MAPIDARSTTGLTIVLVGPESSGKTTLAHALAEHYAAPWVTEAAREHLHRQNLGPGDYQISDIEQIARAQLDAEQRTRATQQGLVFLDTDLLVIDIWWRERFGAPPDWLVESLEDSASGQRRRYLLCLPDLPWEADPLREHPHDRQRLYERYERRLTELGATYQTIAGAGTKRSDAAICAIEDWLD